MEPLPIRHSWHIVLMWGRLVQVFLAALGSGAVFVPLDYLVSHMYTSDNHSYAAEQRGSVDIRLVDCYCALHFLCRSPVL